MSMIHIYLIYMNKPDLVLNILQWLICHKTNPYPKSNTTRMVQNYCYILVHASLQLIHVTKSVQAVEVTHFGY